MSGEIKDPTIPPKTRKPIAWWKAGLLGALISFGCILGYLIFNNVLEEVYQSELFLLAILIVPTLIYTAIYTALNSDHPNNRTHTILVALMSSTITIIGVIWMIAEFAAIFSGTPFGWVQKNLLTILGYFFFTYGSAAIIAIVLWSLFGRKVKTGDESF